METFRAYHTDIHASGWQQHTAAQLREQGLVTFSGITDARRANRHSTPADGNPAARAGRRPLLGALMYSASPGRPPARSVPSRTGIADDS